MRIRTEGYGRHSRIVVELSIGEAMNLGHLIMDNLPRPDTGHDDGQRIFEAGWNCLPESHSLRLMADRFGALE